MAVKELVWDMDGTLLDTTAVVPAALARTVMALGGPETGPGDVVATYWRGTPEVILEHLVGRSLTPAEADVYYRELAGADVAPYPQVVETFAALRTSGRPLVVFTGASSRAARMLLASAGLQVDVLIGGDKVARPKPAPDGVLLAAKILGVEPADVAYVGDSPLDLRAATAAGSRGAAAAWGHMYDHAEPADVVLAGPLHSLGLLTDARVVPGEDSRIAGP